MNLGTQAVFAAYAQLQTTGNNIANANTPGYSRQSVELTTTGSAYNGSGYFGRGVSVSTVNRASNMFLTQQALAAHSASSADGVRSDMLSQLEKVFVGGDAGLGGAATQIFNSFADVAASPADLSARQAALGKLEDFASMSRSASDQIEALQTNVHHDVVGGVDQVNTLAAELAKLNVSIAAATNGGHLPNDLMDQRDQIIQQIGGQVQLHTFIGADETASLFVGSGQNLVLGSVANKLVAQSDAADPSHVTMAVSISGQITQLSTYDIGEGSIGGLMRFQDSDLADARNRLGQLVTAVATAVNQQQGLGLDLQGQTGSPLFAFDGPRAVPAASNAKDGNGAFVASVSLSVVDASALKASDYLLEADPANAGGYIVTRQADGKVFQPVLDGDVIDGFAITMGANGPGPRESFTLKPVSASANNLTVLLKNPQGIAAANPVTAVASAANKGTATVGAVDIVSAPTDPYQKLSINFTDDVGGYEILDEGAGLVASGTFSAGQPIALNGMELSLGGLPRQGDVITIAPTTHPAASNGNALRFDSMAQRLLVDGQTAADAYANALADVGVRVQGALASADNSATVSSQAQTTLTGVVGVNLDEEAARLIQYQQSYQAAAKMLQTAQTLLDTIIGIVR
jgi:flagellar hook-associated protein 1 FlgK